MMCDGKEATFILQNNFTNSAQNRTMAAGWTYQNGTLHCDGLSMEELRNHLRQEFGHQGSPAYVYSSATLKENVRKYTDSLGNQSILSYSLKANANPHILKVLREAGVSAATTVSGNEILMALKCGFKPQEIIFNGNGKRRWEIEMAVSRGVLLNIDSVFDAHQIVTIAQNLNITAKTLLRLNPNLDAHTHPYLTTALASSKFGISMDQVEEVLGIVNGAKRKHTRRNSDHKDSRDCIIDLVGVHIHVGSDISNTEVYAEMARIATKMLCRIHESGWPEANLINLGGGLGLDQDSLGALIDIDNKVENIKSISNLKGTLESRNISQNMAILDSKDSNNYRITPKELIKSVKSCIPEDAILILEPGRSLVATAGVVMTNILGVKRNGNQKFIVVDASMTDVIRPALYGAIHPISYTTIPNCQEVDEFDVVGPVCESGDFLFHGCSLQHPPATLPSSSSGTSLVVWATGAYCSSMASNYNLRPQAIEVLVSGSNKGSKETSIEYKVIRQPQNFEDLLLNY